MGPTVPSIVSDRSLISSKKRMMHRRTRSRYPASVVGTLAVLLLFTWSSEPAVAAGTSSMKLDTNDAATEYAMSPVIRRRLAEDKKDDKDKKKVESTSTAQKVKDAKEAAKKKKTTTTDATADKKKEKPKEPQFSVHKKPISSASLNKVADSVAAAAAAAKLKEKALKADAAKKDKKKPTVTADKKKAEDKKADEKKKLEEKKKANEKKKAEAAKKTLEVKKPDTQKPDKDDHDDAAAKKSTEIIEKVNAATKAASNSVKSDATVDDKPSPPKIPDVKPSAAVQSTSDADKAKEVKPLPSVKKPQTPKDVDKYKDMLKKTRDELVKRNPKLKAMLEERKDAAKRPGGDGNGKEQKPDVSGAKKLEEMAKQMKKKQALAKLRDMLRKQKGGKKDADDKATLLKEAGRDGDSDSSKIHQRRSRPLRPGERVFSKIPIVKRAYKKTPLEENYSDATLSLVEGLKHGIFTDESNALVYRRKEALKDWLNLLAVSLPPELELHSLIDDLRTNLDLISQKKSKFLKMIKKHPIKEKKWSKECSRSKKRSKTGGFSCGFWKLLHIVSVGLAEHRGGIEQGLGATGDGSVVASYWLPNSGTGSNGSAISPSKAAQILREYMALFFGCDVCSRNFLAHYDECAYHRCDRLASDTTYLSDEQWREFSLYLWEVHNGVSVSIFHEKVERKKKDDRRDYSHENEISVIWPHMEQCFQCIGEDGTFSDDHVNRYLIETYWSGPEPDSKDDMLRNYERSLERPMFSNGIFYMSLSMMLIGAWLMKKRYSIKRTGFHKKNDDGIHKQWRRI